MTVKHRVLMPHFYLVEAGTLKLWFSYDTIVAFQSGGTRVVCENVWSTTTGKHLNWIDGGDKEAKAERENVTDFGAMLEAVLA
jgi:hypothetical protein